MVGIAGVGREGKRKVVDQMLQKTACRGPFGQEVVEAEERTLGIVRTKLESSSLSALREEHAARDEFSDGHLAEGRVIDGSLVFARDQLDVAPPYYGRTEDGLLCFASEVKTLLEVTHECDRSH